MDVVQRLILQVVPDQLSKGSAKPTEVDGAFWLISEFTAHDIDQVKMSSAPLYPISGVNKAFAITTEVSPSMELGYIDDVEAWSVCFRQDDGQTVLLSYGDSPLEAMGFLFSSRDLKVPVATVPLADFEQQPQYKERREQWQAAVKALYALSDCKDVTMSVA